jgi:hypothetical protein
MTFINTIIYRYNSRFHGMIVIFVVNGLCKKGHIRMENWMSIADRVGGAPRATPYRRTRFPKIYR